MMKSKPGRAARFDAWRQEHEERVRIALRRRGRTTHGGAADTRLSKEQVDRIEAAGWHPLKPGQECVGRTAPLDLPCPATVAGYIELAVHAREIAWRFGDGRDPLRPEAAEKLAVFHQLQRQERPYDEHDALQRWIEFRSWQMLEMQDSMIRAERLARGVVKIQDGETPLRDRGVSRDRLADEFWARRIGSCPAAHFYWSAILSRPHLELGDAHLSRAMRIALGADGGETIESLRTKTAREALATLMEWRGSRCPEVPALVVRDASGRAIVNQFAVQEVLDTIGDRSKPRESTNRPGWRPRPKKEARLSADAVLQLLEILDGFDGLDERDSVMLTIQALERMVEWWQLSPDGKPKEIKRSRMRRTLILAIDGVVKARGIPAGRRFLVIRRYYEAYAAWFAETLALTEQDPAKLTERQRERLSWLLHARNSIGPPRDWEQFGRATKRAAAQVGQEVEPAMISGYLETCRGLTPPNMTGLFPSKDGRLVLGERQLRERLAARCGFRRHRSSEDWLEDPAKPPSKYSEALDQRGTVELDAENEFGLNIDPPAEGTPDPLQAVAAADTARRMQELVARRLEVTKPGSIDELVLENFERLRDGLSARELGRQTGRAHSPISGAFKKVGSEVLAELGVSLRK